MHSRHTDVRQGWQRLILSVRTQLIPGLLVGLLLFGLALPGARPVAAQARDAVLALVQFERAPLVGTLSELVGIESGSRDFEGLSQLADLIARRLRELGGEVQIVPPADVYRMQDTPSRLGHSVLARFRGTGTRRILLLAHMDTVYRRGMLAQQPFRIVGERAYGLGIADNKHGIAVILHTLSVLRALGFNDYGLITVLINADEEVSSPGSRALIVRLGREHDAVFSCEGASAHRILLQTSGIGAFTLTVRGRASHAGAAPDYGRNALYELAHQILQTRDLADTDAGVSMNWTVAAAGLTRNVIPDEARATADVRVLRIEDYDRIETTVRQRIGNRLIPDTEVSLAFERRRPPLVANAASRALARHAQAIYSELGLRLVVDDRPSGGGTDAAFAALESDAPVLEGLGLHGHGAHASADEFIDLRSIEPRLYLLTSLIIDVAQGVASGI